MEKCIFLSASYIEKYEIDKGIYRPKSVPNFSRDFNMIVRYLLVCANRAPTSRK